ncbi:MAG TPA: hypothetical protein VKJ07_08915, partial [Mycobacteriales bacterium]|nr:hypothetical protein [Mycobacteriales bacterium]
TAAAFAFADTGGRALPLEFARDFALAAFVTAPLALLAVRSTWAPAPVAQPPAQTQELVPAPARGSTRRSFLKVGSTAVAGAALIRVAPAASALPRKFVLTITDGDIHMIDNTPVFFRTFAGVDGKPQIPGPPLGNPGPFETNPEIIEGKTVQVVITNLTPRDHTFLIERTGNEDVTDPVVGPVVIPAGGIPVTVEFTAPSAGTYIYRDADRNNRILGMHGVMVVMPSDGSNRPYTPAPDRLDIPAEFLAQYVWMLHDVDPLLGELARNNPKVQNLDYSIDQLVPRYFTINGVSGVVSTENLVTVPVFPVQDPQASQVGALIRIVNTGCATHSPHIHGNHIFLVEQNATPQPANVVLEKDVFRMPPLHRIAALLPVHPGLDAWPPLDPTKGFGEQAYPMHCHSEMSQTAAGGLYPMGMLTDWRLVAKPQDVAAAKAVVASGKQTQAAKAEITRVLGRR